MSEELNPPSEAARHSLPPRLIHDLRTPLNQIIGYSEMLTEQAQDQGREDFVPDLQKVRTAGRQLLALINDHFHSVQVPEMPVAALPEEGTTPGDQKPAGGAFLGNPELPVTGASRGSLLVVDDIETNRDVLSRQLERQGYSITTAENGREALEMLRSAPFDLVLLDIMMPEIDGYEVLQRLKADEGLRHIPVIMISALSEMDSVVRCIEMGAEDYLPKPFNPTLLKARIGVCLEQKRAHEREAQLFQQLQENYRRLQELEKVRDDLMHMIIHDLRAPLSSVILGMQACGEEGDLNDGQREMLGIAVGGARTLAAMINDLLDISKMEDGSMKLQAKEISAPELVDAALKQVAQLVNQKNLKLAIELEPGLPRLVADESMLLRILINLLSNAIKFTPAEGRVTIVVRTDSAGPSIRFSVSDTGEGIPAEAFGRIFEKFGQVESGQGGRKVGTGLGLAFCKLAVETHGGQIKVESTSGQGSTFAFTIPLQ